MQKANTFQINLSYNRACHVITTIIFQFGGKFARVGIAQAGRTHPL